MPHLIALALVVGLLVAATGAGLLLRRRTGRVRESASAAAIDPADFGIAGLGERGTVVQFSTEYCARCPGVQRQITGLLRARDAVSFAHVDVTHQPQLVKKYGLLQTPTVLLIDAAGHPRARLSGALTRGTLETAINRFYEGS